MAVKPSDIIDSRMDQQNQINEWEKAIDTFLMSGTVHHQQGASNILYIWTYEVRKHAGGNLSRLNRSIKDGLVERYRHVGWKGAKFLGTKFRLSEKEEEVV